MIEFKVKSKISTRIIVQVFRDGVLIEELPEQKNLILTGGMSDLDGLDNTLRIGTGSTTPAFNDTSLVNQISSTSGSNWSDNTPVLNGSVYEKESVNTFDFGVGNVVGNITELGVGGGTLQTRALFKDGGGNPTTIPVLVTDQLIVTYFVTKHVSMVPVTSSVTASNGDIIPYTLRPCISSNADGGSEASSPASIYQVDQFTNMKMIANTSNKITVDPVTFIPTMIDASGDISAEGSATVVIVGTGNEVTHTMGFSISQANFQWVCLTTTFFTDNISSVLFQIEFNGPLYINKASNQTVSFSIKESVSQVV